MPDSSSYLRTLALLSVLCLATVPVFNWLVDPFGVFHGIRISGFNAEKLAKETPKRESKTLQINKLKPDVVILGTSRTLRGIDPDHLTWMTGKKYNYAVTNARLEETFSQLRYAQQLNPLRTVVIGLDFFVFNANNPGELLFDNFLEESEAVQYSKMLLSFDMLMLSKDVVMQKGKSESMVIKENGLLAAKPDRQRKVNIKNFNTILGLYLDKKFFPGTECAYGFSHRDGRNTFSIYREMLEYAHQHNISLVMFVPPDHAWMMEGINQAGLGQAYEYWLRSLVSINEVVASRVGRQTFGIWDFSGFNQVTTEPVPNRGAHLSMDNYYDVAHFTPQIGNEILRKLFDRPSQNKLAKNFGSKLSSGNVEEHLKRLTESRRLWRDSHPAEVEKVSAIFERSKKSHQVRCVDQRAKVNIPNQKNRTVAAPDK